MHLYSVFSIGILIFSSDFGRERSVDKSDKGEDLTSNSSVNSRNAMASEKCRKINCNFW